MRYCSSGATHPGAVRPYNQDAFVDRPEIGLWAAADGVGGHDAGEVASARIKAALEAIAGNAAGDMTAQVRGRLEAVHSELLQMAASLGRHRTIASTVVVLLADDDRFTVLWAGDSRVYRLRDGEFSRVSRDHSLVQEMVDAGRLLPEAADAHPQANVITRAVGIGPGPLALDEVSGPRLPGDRFVVCTDGLFKELAEREIAALARAGEPRQAVGRLLTAALDRGASDNVTAVVVDAAG